MVFVFTDWKGALFSLTIAIGIAALVFTIQILMATARKISWWKNYLGYFCIWVGTGVCCAIFQPMISIVCWIGICLITVILCRVKIKKENAKHTAILKKMHGRKRDMTSKKLPLHLNTANFVLTAISTGIFLCLSFWNKKIFAQPNFMIISLWVASVFAAIWFAMQYWGDPNARRSICFFKWSGEPVRKEGDHRQTVQKWIHAALWFVLAVVVFVLFLICN